MNLANLLSKLQAIGSKDTSIQEADETTKGLKEDDVEEGNEFAQKVNQLKAQGAKPGTKFKTSDGKEHVLEGEKSCDECGEVHEGSCSKSKMKETTRMTKDRDGHVELDESVKTTHEDPLVTVHDDEGLHTHANLSTVNNIFNTSVKHDDVHKGPVNVKSGRDGKNLKIALSKHHAGAVEEAIVSNGPKKVDIPAYLRQAKGARVGDDWKVSMQDLEDDKLRNISSSEWLKKQNDEKVKESELNLIRQLAGIKECGDMSPMTVVGGEPQMGINPAMPAEVPTIGAQTEPEQTVAPETVEQARYTLTIQNGDSNLSMTTDAPEEIIHIMKLAGVKGDAKVEKQADGAEQKTEESFGNTPPQTNEPNPRSHGDIADWSVKGTGRAQDGSAANKPAGQGDNPMRESLAMMEEYRKFINK